MIYFCFWRVPFCNEVNYVAKNSTTLDSMGNKSATAISTLFQRSYPKYGPPTPAMNLKVENLSFWIKLIQSRQQVPPDEVPEEHLTFLFGVFMLISMAVICTLFLMKLAKAGRYIWMWFFYSATNSAFSANDARLNANRCIGGILPSDYSLMLWLPGGTSRHGKSFFYRILCKF